MRSVKFQMFFLAFLVILLFSAVGVAIALRNLWAILILLVLGFITMWYGISLKRKNEEKVTE